MLNDVVSLQGKITGISVYIYFIDPFRFDYVNIKQRTVIFSDVSIQQLHCYTFFFHSFVWNSMKCFPHLLYYYYTMCVIKKKSNNQSERISKTRNLNAQLRWTLFIVYHYLIKLTTIFSCVCVSIFSFYYLSSYWRLDRIFEKKKFNNTYYIAYYTYRFISFCNIVVIISKMSTIIT